MGSLPNVHRTKATDRSPTTPIFAAADDPRRYILQATKVRTRTIAIAATTGMPLGTIKSRMFTGLQRLRVLLTEAGYESA